MTLPQLGMAFPGRAWERGGQLLSLAKDQRGLCPAIFVAILERFLSFFAGFSFFAPCFFEKFPGIFLARIRESRPQELLKLH